MSKLCFDSLPTAARLLGDLITVAWKHYESANDVLNWSHDPTDDITILHLGKAGTMKLLDKVGCQEAVAMMLGIVTSQLSFKTHTSPQDFASKY